METLNPVELQWPPYLGISHQAQPWVTSKSWVTAHGLKIPNLWHVSCYYLYTYAPLSWGARGQPWQEAGESQELSPCPPACPVATTQSRSHQITFLSPLLHCLQYPCQKCPPTTSVFCVFKHFLLWGHSIQSSEAVSDKTRVQRIAEGGWGQGSWPWLRPRDVSAEGDRGAGGPQEDAEAGPGTRPLRSHHQHQDQLLQPPAGQVGRVHPQAVGVQVDRGRAHQEPDRGHRGVQPRLEPPDQRQQPHPAGQEVPELGQGFWLGLRV